MKVAIPSSNKSIDSSVDDRFGRCPFFCLYNQETGQIEFKENNLRNGSGGIGPQVVEFLANNEVNKVIATEVGPKAKGLLDKLKIKTEVVTTKHTVREIIESFNH